MQWLEIGKRTRALGATITQFHSISTHSAVPVGIRACGSVNLGVKFARGATSLQNLRQSGSMKCLFPRNTSKSLQAVLVNTAGGVTGGDSFSISAKANPKSKLTITTQAAERAYRAQPNEIAQIETHLTVNADARLNWVPQETILFEGCAVNRVLKVNLEASASALIAEPLTFGRLAMNETVQNAHFRDRIEIHRAGAPLYLDAARWCGDVQAQLDRPGVAGGARALVSLVYVAPDAQSRLAQVRKLLPEHGGASLLHDDVLVLRALAVDSYALRSVLIPILNLLSPDGLPRCWML